MTVASRSPEPSRDRPFVSIVMPIRDEAAHLDQALSAIQAQSYPAHLLEILIVDGGSTDGTLEQVRAVMARDDRIRLLGGPGVNTPEAMNIGTEAASGDLVAKIDGHGWINEEFIGTGVDVLTADETSGCVGGRIVPVAETPAERAISYARFSRLGVGGGPYTAANTIHAADTVQCGIYRRSVLVDVGGFDPRLAYGEDEELNYRVRRAGWQITFHPGMQFHYRVRPTLRSLFRQYFRYGRARVAVIRKHPPFFSLKHAIPATLVLTLLLAVALTASPRLRPLGLLILGSYAALIGGGSAWLAVKNRHLRPDLIAGSLLALHLGYGLGTLAGLHDRTRKTSPEGDRGAAEDG